MRKDNLVRVTVLLTAFMVVALVIITAGGINFDSVTSGQRDNFFEQFFIAGGPVVWFVLFPLSLVTIYLAAEHFLTINKKRLIDDSSEEQLKRRISRLTMPELHRQLAARQDLVGVAFSHALEKGRGDWFRMRSIVQESLQEQAGRMLRKIEWLNLIGGVSPMVGLFGTVFGMIKLFNSIVATGGQPQPAHLADGIGIALVTTFWGLFIAIPAVALHGIFRNRVEMLIGEALTQSETVVSLLKDLFNQKTVAQDKTGWAKLDRVPIIPLKDGRTEKKNTASEKM